MTLPVLFVGNRPLERSENIKAIWDAYDGRKVYATKANPSEVRTAEGRYSCIVADDFITYIDGKDTVKTIMVTHGMFGDKTYGLQQPHPYHTRRSAEQLDYVITSSKHTRQLAAEQCGVDISKVLALGLPRADAYHGKCKGDGGTEYASRTMYLYVPTFRSPMPNTDWDELDGQLNADETLLVKRHPVTKQPLLRGKTYKHIVEIDAYATTTPYLIDCDVVISDYSSTTFDGYVLGKPSVLYCPDWYSYLNERGMAYDYPTEYGSRWLGHHDMRALVDLIRDAKEKGMGQADRDCLNWVASAVDGRSTERVIALIKEVACGS